MFIYSFSSEIDYFVQHIKLKTLKTPLIILYIYDILNKFISSVLKQNV